MGDPIDGRIQRQTSGKKNPLRNGGVSGHKPTLDFPLKLSFHLLVAVPGCIIWLKGRWAYKRKYLQ